jgi:dihydrolipoamide dehydrogenase
MEAYDFVVVGSGSGLDVAGVAAGRGESVAVVGRGRSAGPASTGAVPSKRLLYQAHPMETVERAGEFGIEARVEAVDAGIVEAVAEDVAAAARRIERGLGSSPRHALHRGAGRFVDERTLRGGGFRRADSRRARPGRRRDATADPGPGRPRGRAVPDEHEHEHEE